MGREPVAAHLLARQGDRTSEKTALITQEQIAVTEGILLWRLEAIYWAT